MNHAALFTSALLFANISVADLNSNMDSLYEGMSNTTPGGTFETQRRVGISGGSYVSRNAIFNQDIVSFNAPSARGGCNGIDLYGGSFSMIDSDQFINLLKAVASNAEGYLFQIALDNMFPDGMKIMNQLSEKIQGMNKYLGNSCRLTQQIMNQDLYNGSTAASVAASTGEGVRNLAVKTGQSLDLFDTSGSSDSTDDLVDAAANNPSDPEVQELYPGNIVWHVMTDSKYPTIDFNGSGLSKSDKEAFMSLVGTTIVSISGAGTSADPHKTTVNNVDAVLKYEDLLIGNSEATLFECETTTECLDAGDGTKHNDSANITGMYQKIKSAFLGAGGNASTDGIIYKFANNKNTLTSAEKGLLEALPGTTASLIVRLAVIDKQQAVNFTNENIGSVANHITYQYALNITNAVRRAVENLQNKGHQQSVIRQIESAERSISGSHKVMTQAYGNLSQSVARYNAIIVNIRKNKYASNLLSISN